MCYVGECGYLRLNFDLNTDYSDLTYILICDKVRITKKSIILNFLIQFEELDMSQAYNYAEIYWSLGLNIVTCDNKVTALNIASNDILKCPGYDYSENIIKRQERNDFEQLSWNSVCAIGAVTGYENLVTIDVDGCIDEEFPLTVLEILGLKKNYEWIYKTGSHTGYQIIVQIDGYHNLQLNRINSFSSNEDYKFSFNKIEILKGTCAILPPSFHSSGLQYEFLNCRVPTNFPKSVKGNRILRLIEKTTKSAITLSSANMWRANSREPYRISDLPNFKYSSQINIEKTSFEDYAREYGALYLVFDIETDGLITEEEIPNILQIAWCLMDVEGTILKRKSSLIYPTGKNYAENINGINTNISKYVGNNLKHVLSDIINDINISTKIIAHSIDFDLKVLNHHLKKQNFDPIQPNKHKDCTMIMGAKLFKKMGKSDGKYPKLKELYDGIFETDIREVHNAVYDVFLTSKIYYYMLSVKYSTKI